MRPMLHLETFTGDDLPSYLTRSRARVEQLPAAQRTILVIAAGAVLVQLAKPDQTLAYGATVQATADSPSGSLWVKVQQTQAASGNASPPVLQPVGPQFWISYANLANPSGCVAWSTFPLKLQGAAGPTAAHLRAIPIADLNAVAKDDQGNTWYQVPVGVDDGNTALGWVCDKNHPLVKLDSPWAWPGFEALELDASVADLFKRSIHLSDGSVGAEKIPFEQTFEALRSSALLKKLEDILDCRGDRNGKITAVELRGALREPWLADIIQRLTVRYESEWGGEMSKWDALTSLMNDGAPVWNAEMTRINALRFWPGVAAVKEFPVSAKVYHWHPVGLVGNFISTSSCIPLPKAQLMALTISSGFEGNHPMDYAAVANNFDGMGMSYGLIQWNAGSGTLGPVLVAMRNADQVAFKSAFPSTSNYEALDSALTSGDSGSLYNWAVQQQSGNSANWKTPFQNLAQIQTFKDIQVATAVGERHQHVLSMIEFLRSMSPDLMESVELVSYCDLFDVAVQQTSLAVASTEIKARVSSENPASQLALIRIAVEERAKAAKHPYVADCMSRRIGILQQSAFSYTAFGNTSQRTNLNFNTISQDANKYVCKI